MGISPQREIIQTLKIRVIYSLTRDPFLKFCLFVLLLYVPVNSYGHGGREGHTDFLTFGYLLGTYIIRKSSQESESTQQIPDNFTE